MEPVFVISSTGKKLMPTFRFRKVRHLLKDGQAKIIGHRPFTIQLLYETTEYVQELELTVDSGYVNAGVSLKSEKREYLSQEYTLLTDEKQKHDDARSYRRTRRNRLRYRAPRFNNRVSTKKEGWIAPSLQHKVDAQVSIIEKICNVAPVKYIKIEVGVFDPFLLDVMNTTGIPPQGVDYQHGPLYYADNLRAAVFQRDKYTCQICGKSALKYENIYLHVHHALYWKKRHADTLKECITVCSECHTPTNHTQNGKLWGLEPDVPRLEDATYMNIVRWKFINKVKKSFPIVEVTHTYGSETSRIRKKLGIEKSHANDAYCIGKFHPKLRVTTTYYKKKRRNNRCLEKFYDAKVYDIRDGSLKSGKDLGCNRTNRRKPRLSENNLRIFRGDYKKHGERRIRKQRYSLQPNDIVLFQNKRYPVKGIISNGNSVLLLSKKDSPTGKALAPSVKKVKIIRFSSGWIQHNSLTK